MVLQHPTREAGELFKTDIGLRKQMQKDMVSDCWKTAPGPRRVWGKNSYSFSGAGMHLLTQQLASGNRTQAVNPVSYLLRAPPCIEEELGTERTLPCSLLMCVEVWPELLFKELFLLLSALSAELGAHPSLAAGLDRGLENLEQAGLLWGTDP